MTPTKEIKLLRELAKKIDAQAEALRVEADALIARANKLEDRAKKARKRATKKATAPVVKTKKAAVIRRPRKVATFRPHIRRPNGSGRVIPLI